MRLETILVVIAMLLNVISLTLNIWVLRKRRQSRDETRKETYQRTAEADAEVEG